SKEGERHRYTHTDRHDFPLHRPNSLIRSRIQERDWAMKVESRPLYEGTVRWRADDSGQVYKLAHHHSRPDKIEL
ncbi:MAG: hypothetical protein ACRD3E_06340, partial [Terriglobales bacterium]